MTVELTGIMACVYCLNTEQRQLKLRNSSLSYDQRVTVVIRYLRKHWYTVSGVIT